MQCKAVPVVPTGLGAWFGSAYTVQSQSVPSYIGSIGFSPALFNIFVTIPLNSNGTEYLQLVIPQMTAIKAIVMITATPDYGLAAVTEAAVSELAFYISQAEQVCHHAQHTTACA